MCSLQMPPHVGIKHSAMYHLQVEAVKVLLEHVSEGGLQRAYDYASKVCCAEPRMCFVRWFGLWLTSLIHSCWGTHP
jgi:hypothetical protein